MSIWNKVLAGLIIVAALAFWFFSMQTLKVSRDWREKANALEKQINQAKTQAEQLQDGTPNEPGIAQLQLDLHKFLVDRGRVWRNVEPRNVDRNSGQVSVVVDQPAPHGIGAKTTLFVFDQAAPAQGGHFLGEFIVDAVGGRQLALVPANRLTMRQINQLAASKGPWLMYETMPVDKRESFAGLSEQELKDMLPEATVADYIRQGKPATAKDLESWGVNGLIVDAEGRPLLDDRGQLLPDAQGFFSRQLRDYTLLIDGYHTKLTTMVDALETLNRDVAKVESSLAAAKQEITARKNDIAQLKLDVAEMQRQRDAAAKHEEDLDQRIASLRKAVQETIVENRQLAQQLAKMQEVAASQINAQAATPATAPATTPAPAGAL